MTAPVTYEELLKKIKDLEESIETYQVLVNNSPDLLYLIPISLRSRNQLQRFSQKRMGVIKRNWIRCCH